MQQFELSDVMPVTIHLTVPRRFRKPAPSGVILHKADLTPAEHESRGPYRITSPLRTLLDVAASAVSEEHLHACVHEALCRGLVDRRALQRSLPELAPAAAERLRRAPESTSGTPALRTSAARCSST